MMNIFDLFRFQKFSKKLYTYFEIVSYKYFRLVDCLFVWQIK
ncbi:unnamed protein product [Brugia pahangi]|uniref:Uncharacterized protein n=1 Tax=Brugia pahangi TaxID=6280 RepID=A0A0N4TDQ3_BRUPA|nr:unnamed protein product [Brugia pahangi]